MADQNAAPASGGGTRLFYIVLGAIALGGLASIVYTLGASGSTATEPVDLSGLDDPRDLYELAVAVKTGPDDAPVKVVEFADYQCGGCRTFALRVVPVLDEYIERGDVQLVYYDFPLVSIHTHAFLAARAGRCAEEQGRFWDYHKALFRNQATWARKQDAASDFVDLAAAEGLDASSFAACLRSDAHADVVSANRALAEQIGIRSTPTVIVNNRRLVAPSARALEDVIGAELDATTGG